MRSTKILRLVLLWTGLTVVGVSGSAFTLAAQAAAYYQDPQADNTKANKGDGTQSAATADRQKENPADREIARKIRQSIVQDKSLSTYAHNVKVVVRDGQVTLKGPVRNEDEKRSVGSKAADVAGADKMQNELTVKS